MMLDETTGKDLIRIARLSIESAFTKEAVDIPHTNMRFGAFVTLRENGDLRGCIGYMQPIAPLYRQIFMLAHEAAFNDYRFMPLEKTEVEKCRIAISVLSPFQKIGSLEEFRLGEHGILMEAGHSRAVFLPQVAIETGWTKEELLAALSKKAGLADDTWKREVASFYVFTAEVFEEDEM